MHLTEENLRLACDVLTTRGSWQVVAHRIGCAESLLYNWLSRSRKAEAERDVTSPFWMMWRENDPPDWWHNFCKKSRRDNILSLEAIMRDQVRNGLSEPIFDGNGNAVWEQDAKALAEWAGDAEAARTLGGLTDPFHAHDPVTGARIQARRQVQVPASLRAKVLAGLIPAFADHSNVDVAVRGQVVHVMEPPKFVSRHTPPALSAPTDVVDAECTEVPSEDRPDIVQLRQQHAALMAKPLNERRVVPDGFVRDVNGVPLNTGRRAAPPDDPPDDQPLPADPLGEYTARDHPRAYSASTPAPERSTYSAYPKGTDPRRPGAKAMKITR